MAFQDLPIKRKVMNVILMTSVAVLLVTTVAFLVYDLVSYRQLMVRNLSTTASIIADNSTAALAFKNDTDAQQVLAALHADRHIVAAALYDEKGKLFARYPATRDAGAFPAAPDALGHRFTSGHLVVFQAVAEGESRYGTLYLNSDLQALYERPKLYGGISVLVLACSLLVAIAISTALQRRITGPILALARNAEAVSLRGDYSVRTPKVSGDELGVLTDAFNLMLDRIQEQVRAVQESEARKTAILESAIDCVITMDEAGRIVDFNPAAERTFGYSKQVAFGRTVAETIIPERLRQGHWKGMERFKETGQAPILGKRLEMPALRADGTEFPVELAIASTKLANGASFFTAYLRDITERKRAEESVSFLASIVASSDDAVVGKDLQSKVVSWNAGAERMFGYTAAEMLGQPITRLVAPDHTEEETVILEQVKRGQISHLDTVRIHKDGHAIEVSLTVSPIKNPRGEIIGLSSIARDVTLQKRAQEVLEHHALVLREQAQMLDLANLLARDLDDKVILWNTGMEKMYGWSKAEAMGKSSHELLRTQFPQPRETIRAELMRQGKWEGELTQFRKGGQSIHVASQWVLHSDAQGRPIAILEINNDITERKRAEAEVLRINAELEQRVADRTAELTAANQELEAFTYSVAHDLRAPLRHIDAFTRILHDDFGGNLPPEAKRYLENIRSGSRNMSQLVDDLLNLARVGRQELKRQPTPLEGLVTDVVTDLKRETEGRAIEWRIHPLPTISCDSGLMKQVFINLLSNAIKYTRPRQTAVIEVGSRQVNGTAAVFVEDNGVGFNMKYADKLFGVFQRLHRAEDFEGTGVGLATVDRIVRKHGGSVWAEAIEDKGATFYFTVEGLDKETKSG